MHFSTSIVPAKKRPVFSHCERPKVKRVNIHDSQPAAYQAMFGLEKYLGTVDLPARLVELVRTMASQINGCAYCIQLHSTAARKHGETVERLLALAAWKESPLFSAEECAAFALTDEITRLSANGVSDEVYGALHEHFSDDQKAQLIMLIAIINAWNRIAVSTHVQ